MYQTYRFKHPAVSLEQNAYDQFFYGTLFLSFFLYLFSFYFAYQTTEIVKHFRSGSSVVSVSKGSLKSQPLSQIGSGQTVIPLAPMAQTQPVTRPKIRPAVTPPLDVAKAIENATHQVKPISPVSDLLPFNYMVKDQTYEVNFSDAKILFRQKADSSVKTDLELELASIQTGREVLDSFSKREKIKPVAKGNVVSYQKTGNIKETYESKSNGLEQSWVFEKPPSLNGGKDLVVTQKLITQLTPRYGFGGVIDFYDTRGNYITTYGKGTLKDAAGKRADVLPRIIPGSKKGIYELTMTLPTGWLTSASYPLILDPLIGNKLQVDSLTGGDYLSSVAFDGTNYLVAWMNGAVPGAGANGGASNIYGAIVSPAGTVLATTPAAPFVIDNSANDQMYPSIAYNGGLNNFLVVYGSYTNTTALNDIIGKVVSYTGTTVTIGTAANIAATNSDEQYPSVATDGTGSTNNTYITYALTSGTTSTINVVPATTSASSFTVGTAFAVGVATNTTAPSVLPSISYGLNGTYSRYLIAWENFSAADPQGNIYANIVTKGSGSPGLAATSPLGVAVAAATPERYPKVAYDGTNYLVAYQRGAAGSVDIYAQFVTSSSAPALSGSALVVSNAANDQTWPVVAFNSTLGTYLFAWTDARNSTTNTDIYGARMTTAGSVLDTGGVNISNIGTSAKSYPSITSSGSNFYIPWRDSATNSGNIYGQLVGPPQITSLSPNPVQARNPLTINSVLYGSYGTFGPDPGSANRSTASNNVTWNGSTAYQIGNADVTAWGLTPGINSSIGITAPYATAVTGGVAPIIVTSTGWASTPSVNLTVQDFALTVSPSSTTVLQGNAPSYTVTLSTTNAFSSTVNLSLSSSGPCPGGDTCSFSPSAISGNGSTSQFTVTTTASSSTGTFSLAVQGQGGSNNQISHITTTSLTINSAAPMVTSMAATNIFQTTATLNGSVNPNGFSTNYWFEYGTTTSYGFSTSTQSLAGGTTTVAVSAGIIGLTANTTYHFRIDASNSAGTSYGADTTFTTLANPPIVTTGSATSIGSNGATLNGTVNPNGVSATGWFEYGTTASYGTSTTTTSIAAGTTAVSVSASIGSLSANMTYHFRIDATNNGGTSYGTDGTFTTLANAPIVTTSSGTALTQTGATLNGTVNPNGVTATAWFEYGTTASYGSSTTTTSIAAGTTAVSVSTAITALTANTTYHFRIDATNNGGTSYGTDGTFTTLANAPIVTTGSASGIGINGATLNGTVNPNGVTATAWFEYGTTASYGSSTTTTSVAAGTTAVSVSTAISGLTANTTYHFRIDATNNGGTSTGTDATFTTLANPPTVTTGSATGISQTGATLNGTVNPNGVTATAWFEYGLTNTYGLSTSTQSLVAGTTAVSVSAAISGLTANTTYHFRIDATNNGGTSTGTDATFTTLANPPTVTTGSATGISQTGATLNGTVNPNGVTATAWFEYGLTNTYGLSTSTQSLVAGTTAVSVSAAISGLTANTTYHFRIDATNNGGTGTGTDATFTTLANPPAVTTGSATNIGSYGATLNGTVNPNGVTATAWFEYGTTTSYGSSTATQSIVAGTTAVSVSINATSLSALTTYHFRIDASNNGGTSYGTDATFSTLAAPPIVATGSATALTQTTGTLNGTVNPNGVTATAWFEYGTTTSYGSSTATQSIAAGTTAVSVSSAISSLIANTTYHFRVDATNSGGTSYGTDATFTTLANPPIVTTGSATAIASNSATLNGTVNPNGVTAGAWFEYGTTTSYGSSTATQSLAAGTTAVSVSGSVTGLSGNTTYHLRIDASNNGGTSYGADASFTTLANPPTVTTGSAASILQTTATLNGTVNPNGVTATAWFEYGTTTSYGSSTATQSIAAGTTAVSVSVGITGLTANTTYHFRIDANNNGGTSYGTDNSFTTLANVPTVTTGSAAGIGGNGATLNGTVNPNGVTATAWFEYGTTTSYGLSTATQSLAAGTTAVPVSAAISGLSTNTTYHFRIDATNNGGTSYGTDNTFTTLSSAPIVTTGSATNLTQTGTTLNGTVNPNGVTATAWFEYGATTSYGLSTATQSLAAGTTAVSVSAAITGLTANTTYHFRVDATNNGGTSYGADATFITLANPPTVTTGSATGIGGNGATLNGTVNPNGVTATAWFEYGTTTSYGSSTATQSLAAGTTAVSVSASITGLSGNTTYHFRVDATNNGGTSYGLDNTLTTLAGAPIVTTGSAASITQTGATLNGTVNPSGVSATAWFEYGTTTSYGLSTSTQSLAAGTTAVSVSSAITGLTANTVYHFRIDANNNGGTSYGADATFTTLANLPTVTTGSATSIGGNGATLNGTVNPNGVTATAWFEYGTTTSYGSSTATQSIAAGTTAVSVSSAITGLSGNTTYHFRIDATNNGGTSQGLDNTFTTLAGAPVVTTGSAASISQTGATLNGTVNPNGVTATAWFEYGLTTSYGSSTATQSIAAGTTAVSISAIISSLSSNTTYHFRIDANNNGGTSYGADATFITLANLPTVTTGSATGIGGNGGTLNGTVNPNGVTATAWFEYGTTTSYGSSTATQSLAAGTTAVSVSAAISGLAVNTTYHFRIDATNNGGTSYGADNTFTTLASAPIVTTGSATGITSAGATLNGSVNPNGTVTTAWFEYGTTTSYGSSTATQSIAAGTTAVSVSSAITGLTANTVYHFRVDATNNGGTSYGIDATFTTLANLPTVTTGSATSISGSGAILNGTVNPNGVSATAWFEYGTTTSYGSSTATQSFAAGTTAVSVSAAITGLTANTVYHFRIDATNNGGTSYGTDATFTTLAVVPAVVTGSASGIGQTGATLNGTVNPNGVAATAWFEYGLTNTYGSSTATQSIAAGTTAVSVSAAISGLTVNTTYHFRIDAANNGGTSSGTDVTFTTLASGPTVTTGSASSMTQTGATLNGTVNPNGVSTTAWFEYGTTTSYGLSTVTQSLAAGTTAVSVSASITGLTANTVYHFRIDANNNGGTSSGTDASFTTLANLPTVTTGSATGIGGNGATLNGTINPNGVTATAWFEYGTTTSYGSSTVTQSIAAGTTAVSVSASITGLSANTIYHFRVDAANNGGTSYATDATFTTLAGAPTVTTGAGTSLTQTGATLNGTVNPNGVTATAWFEYGTTTSYGSSTVTQSIAAGTTAVSVSSAITGLTANTTYHFRIDAANNGGTSSGTDASFTTLATLPTVTTGSATSVGGNGATLNGTVNPNGVTATAWFEYGTTTSYGSSTVTQSIAAGTTAVSVSSAITGLTVNTTYHFRIDATNNGGTSYGADNTFTTLASAPIVTTGSATSITQTGATLNGTVNPNGNTTTAWFEYGATTSYGLSTSTQSIAAGTTAVSVSAAITALTANTVYHFRIDANNNGGTSYGADNTFTTLANLPTVTTGLATSVGGNGATLNGTVNPNGVTATAWFEYGTTTSYGLSTVTQSIAAGTAAVSVSASITGLTVNTTYHFRIDATNNGGTSYGADNTFTTLANAPIVTTGSASGIGSSGATLNGTVNPNGTATTAWFEYGTTTSYGSSTATQSLAAGTTAVAVSSAITGLSANTIYHFRVDATNNGGTSYGTDATFTTLAGAPTVTTGAGTGLTQTGATLNGTVNPNGVTATAWFEYGATTSYGLSTATQSLAAGTTAVSVSSAITGLSANTTYHFRVDATNNGGTSYGTDNTFITLANPPTVTTGSATGIGGNGATLNGTINPNGVTATAWFEYGTTTSYGLSTATQSIAAGTVAVSVSTAISGLSANTTYHFRIDATNNGGTSYGVDNTFTTLAGAPTVTTGSATAISSSGATLNGTVNPNGVATTAWFEYGTTTSYGLSTSTQSLAAGTTAVSVSSAITGLTANTVYHFRIDANNNGGTSYGADATFTTLASPPTVTTGSATSVGGNGATLNGTVNPNGVTATAWFEYGTTTSYGSSTATQSIAAGTTAVSVSSAITGLSGNTTYHFRIDATNNGGTSQGLDNTFTTLAGAPVVTTGSASGIGQTGATLNGTVNPNGVTATAWFEYGLTTSYGSSAATQSISAGTTAVSISAIISSLSSNTTYHFRIDANNNGGTSYGADATFITLANLPTVTTGSATGIGGNGGTLNGTVNPNGVTATAWFEYGTTTSYGSSTATQSLAAGTTAVSVSAAISGLAVNTTYHFRIDATNNGGTSYGADNTFTTLASAPIVTTGSATGIGSNGATLNGTVNPNGTITTAWFEYGTTTSYGSSTATQSIAAGTTAVSVSTAITGLTANTSYHFRIDANNNGGTSYGPDAIFTTLANPPTVATGAATSLSGSGATLNGTVNPNGVAATAWFEYGTTTSYGLSTATQSLAAGTTAVSVSAAITGLATNTVYHFRIDATNNGGTGYGTDATFTTLAVAPAVVTGSASGIGQTGATLNGTVNPNGVAATAWFEYGLTNTYGSSTATQSIAAGTTAVSVSAAISGLTVNTTYHFRIDAANNGGTSSGTDVTFTTLASGPTVTTGSASSITQTGATLNGTVNPNGVSTTAWFEYGTTTSYGLSTVTQSLAAGTTAVSVSASITGLTANTVYHFRIDANNNGGTSSGTDASFTTLANLPTVTTGSATGIGGNGATLNGTINPNGVTATAWFEYGTTTSYGSSTVTQSLAAGTTAVSVSAAITGLTGNTTYHFRIDGRNNGGTSTGTDATFTTLAGAPTVTTGSASGIGQTAGTLNGTVNPNGVTATAWFEYGTTTSYGSSTVTQSLAAGTTAVSVSAIIGSLSANATYHFRIDAANNGGTSSGTDASFTTLANPPTVTTGSATSVGGNGATLNGTVNPNGVTATAWFEYGTTTSYGSSTVTQSIAAGTTAVSVSSAITGLTVNTTYHFRIDATNNGGTSYGTDNTFTTLASAPIVTTGSASGIAQTSATLNGTVNPNGVAATAWFEYGLTNIYGLSTTTQSVAAGTTAIAVSAGISALTANTIYHFRIDATNNGGTSYGADNTFTTLANLPTVTTGSATSVGGNGATLNGTVNPNGVTATAWFEWGTSTSYGNSNAGAPQSLAAGSTAVSVTLIIGSLTANTTYHFRIDATNNGGTSYGADNTFTTLANAPIVTTGSASGIGSSGATLNGTVNPNGVTATAWFEYGTTTSYGSSTATQSLAAGTTAVAVSSAITGLSANTIYHFRVDATNNGGTSYGTDATFTTLAGAPTVTTGSATTISGSGATLNGTVNPNGVTATAWFEYGLTNTYGLSTATQSIAAGTSAVSISSGITGLTANTTYHFRVDATNNGGTSYGSDASFTTLANPPTVTTGSATSISSSGGTLNGTVNPNGVTATAWFEYGTTTAYGLSTAQQTLVAGTTAVSVSANVISLSANTLYHFRIDANNNGGTTFGLDATFTTLANAPTVTTGSATTISQSGATLNGTVNPNGVSATAWFEYGTSTTYGLSTAAQSIAAGTTAVAVSGGITGLSSNTLYHFRIDATNGGGTSFGSDVTFTTLAVPPTVITGSAGSIGQSGAILNGTVNPNGVTATAWFEFGTTASYGSSTATQSIAAGTTAVSVSAAIGGLSANTTYHFRIDANNNGGTSYGLDATFTTLANAPTVTTGSASNIMQTGGTLNGTVNPNGNTATAWFEYGTTTSYGASTVQQSIAAGTTAVAVSAAISGLSTYTTYHFRIDANNNGGTSFGSDATFTTLANPPTVTTGSATGIGSNSGTLNGTVNPNGVLANAWFEYGLTNTYGSSTSQQSIAAGTAAVSVSAAISGLTANTTYHFRIDASNNGGTSYGLDSAFTTLANAPTVTTGSASNITQTGATLNGTVNPNGVSTTAWFEYGTTTSYGSSTATQSIAAGTAAISVSAAISGLSANIIYHFRIDASNNGGTSYGLDGTFTTLATAPAVITGSATNLVQTGATLNGTVNPNGVTATAWFEYGTTASYGSSTTQTSIAAGTTAVSISSAIGGLTVNTTYHFRIDAANNGGTSYGSDNTFTTLANLPVVTTGSATAIVQTTATLNGTVNPNGVTATAWFEYGLTNTYGSSTTTQSIAAGTTAASVSIPVTGLSANTTYHFRIDASNNGGTSYGTDASFTTLANSPTVVTGSASSIAQTTATLNGTVNPNGTATVSWFEYGTTTSYGSSTPQQSIAAGTTAVSVSAGMTGLTTNTTYHFRLDATNNGGTGYGADTTFTTLANPPVVTTGSATNIIQTGATLNGTVNPNGAATTAWFEYGTTASYGLSTASQSLAAGTTGVAVSSGISALAANTIYHFRIDARNNGGTSYGTDATFTTLANTPTVTTGSASTILQTTATLNGSVNPNGVSATAWFEYGTTASYGSSMAAQSIAAGTTAVAVSSGLTGLTANTVYHFRIDASNNGGTSYGSDNSFTTLAFPPAVTTGSATGISQTGATLNGTVNPNGVVTTAWFEYGTTASYGSSTSTQSLAGGTTAVALSSGISALAANTIYHFRIDASNNGGTSYGADATFTTLANAPAVTTGSATNIAQTSAVLNGTVNPNGAAATAWFEYGITNSYGLSTSTIPISAVTTAVSVSTTVSSLSVNTIYHFRIDASNNGGTSYGADNTFTTLANPPTVTTGSAANITQTGATLNGTVNPNGVGATAWFEWGTTTLYGSSNASTPASIPAGTATVSVSLAINGLTANTIYHFRIDANNNGGTSYGTDGVFTTLANPPVVTTGAATSITQTTATLNGSVNPNGVSATAWFEWGTSTIYGNSNASAPQAIATSSSAVNFSLPISGLTANTTYHFRADATNNGGTTYGSDNTFTTLAIPPVVTTGTATIIGQLGATLNGTVNPNGVSATAWFEWGTTGSYGSSNGATPQTISSSTTAVPVSLAITGLTPNTMYHFRIDATNNGGTSLGSDATFTTLPLPPTVTTGYPATNITQTSAIVTGSVNPNGYAAAAWFEWGITTSYGSSNFTSPQSIPAGMTTVNMNPYTITGLTANTTYHYRADASSIGGTGYGADASFTTLANPPVVVTGSPATNISQTSASLNGTANPNGVNGIAWFDYGLTTSYNLSSQTQAISGPLANSVVISIFGLTANTTYHYRIGATNNGGTTFGADASFTTLPNPPIVTTVSPATNITQTSVAISATVNPNGVPATAWFEWGLSSSYGSSNASSPQSIGSGTTAVSYSLNITGLSPYSTYHYRGDAANAGGTGYGVDAVFTTLPLPPVVTTLPATAIFQTTATLNGTVNPNGAPGTAFFNYGLTTAYGSATSTVPISGTATMNIAVLVGNLISLTTYHFQIVAYNAGGTSYGADASFATTAYPPSVITGGTTNIGLNSATVNGTVNPNGLPTTAWFEWGVTPSYGTSNFSTAQNIPAGTSWVNLTPVTIGSLLANTTYHYRVDAQSGPGLLTTGVDKTFTTLSGGVSPPGLSFSSDPGYNSVLGYAGTNPYLFKVVYTSPSNLAPASIGLYLDGSNASLQMMLDYTSMGAITAASNGLTINNSTIADGIVGVSYSQSFTATGGTPPYAWSVSTLTPLPAGLTLNSSTGLLSGTPSASGTYPLTINVTDAGNFTSGVNINLVICSYTTGCQYRVATPTLLSGTGFYYFGASDGTSTVSLSSSGVLTGPTVIGASTSTPVGNNVVVTPVPSYAISFATVNSSGNTTVSPISTWPILPSSYTVPTTNIYFTTISTTAGYAGTIATCINYNSAYFINQNAIVMLHYDPVQAKWINVTSYLDTVHNIVCGITTSLSPFALVMTSSTAVGLSSFTTTAGDNNVMIEWDTQTETNQLGFNILRSLSIDGPFTRINSQMIPSRGNTIYGAHYRFFDYGATNGATYYYKLESVDTGSRSLIQFVSIATPHSADFASAQQGSSFSPESGAPKDQTVPPGKNGLLFLQSVDSERGSDYKNSDDTQGGKKNEPVDLIPVNFKIGGDKVILSWIPLDSLDSYNVWRSEEKNGFYQMINERVITPEVLGNMDEKDYLIKAVFEDRAIGSGKTYYYKIERIVPGNESRIVGTTFVKLSEPKEKKPVNESKGLELLQPVIIDHSNK